MKHFSYNSITSTNDEAKRLIISQQISDPFVVIADEQTKGRGTKDRVWYSSDKGGLYYSFVKPFEDFKYEMSQDIVNKCSDSIIKVSRQLTHLNIEKEWPNDLILSQKKCGGILLESWPVNNKVWLCIGIGLNVNQTSFPDYLEPVATSFFMESQKTYSLSAISEAITACLLNLNY